MNYNDILEFVTKNPVCTLATSTGNQPHVRAFLTNIIDDKFYFTTSLNKNVGLEIQKNQLSQLCYLSADFSTMLRIETTLKLLDDKEMKQHLIDTKDYLKYFSADDASFVLFTLSNSKATFWRLENNMKEDEIEKIMF